MRMRPLGGIGEVAGVGDGDVGRVRGADYGADGGTENRSCLGFHVICSLGCK